MLMRENLTYLHSNLFAYKHKTTFAEQWAHIDMCVCEAYVKLGNGKGKGKGQCKRQLLNLIIFTFIETK